MGELAVIMTATIDPSTGPFRVHRANPETRLNDYVCAARFWLSIAEPRIASVTILENSGFSEGGFREALGNTVSVRPFEYISIEGNSAPPGLDYGYAELAMIEEGYQQSRLIPNSNRIIKVTGRLMFPQITNLLRSVGRDFVFAADTRRLALGRWKRIFTPTQLILFERGFFEQVILHSKGAMSPERCRSLEEHFYDLLWPYEGKDGCFMRFPVGCDPVGWAAHWKKRYDSPTQRVACSLRNTCRVWMPGVWF
jgi:hypothetical protein